MKIKKSDLDKILRRHGGAGRWKVAVTGASHLRLRGPRGQVIITGSSPSDHRALAYLKRARK
jgi:hypothetical protein